MPRSGTGIYTLPPGNPVVSGTVISSATHNSTMNDIATALTGSLAADGQTPSQANQPMGGFHHTGVSDATARDQYASMGQAQDSAGTFLTGITGSGTADLTAVATPTLPAYVPGQVFSFSVSAPNVGPTTMNISGLGARPILKRGAALIAGDIAINEIVQIVNGSTSFHLQTAGDTSSAFTNNYALFTGTTILFTAGTPPNYTATAPGLTAMVAGQRFRVHFHAAGAVVPPITYTLRLNGLGIFSIYGITIANGGYNPAIVTSHYYDLQFDGSNFIVLNPVPGDVGVGELFWWMLGFNPAHGILCNGASVSRTTYGRLYNMVGNTYGAGDGSTTFNVPYLESGLTLISTPGGSEGVLNSGSAIAHGHTIRTTAIANVGSSRLVVDGAGATNSFTESAGGTHNYPGGRYARLCIRF